MLLWNGSTILKAKLKDRTKADSAYEDVVDRNDIVFVRRDPALIEYLGDNQYRFKIYPVAINNSRRIRILYTIPLSPFMQRMAFTFNPAFTCGATEGFPTSIPIELNYDSSDERKYLFEYNNKKREIQTGSVYVVPYSDIVNTTQYWAPRLKQPIRILGDSVVQPTAFLHLIDTGSALGRYYALYAPVPVSLLMAVDNQLATMSNIEAVISAGNKHYIVDVTDKRSVVAYIKTSSEWDGTIAWNLYDKDGDKTMSVSDTIPVNESSADYSILPLIWAAKYSL
jgi:hypothetical protein